MILIDVEFQAGETQGAIRKYQSYLDCCGNAPGRPSAKLRGNFLPASDAGIGEGVNAVQGDGAQPLACHCLLMPTTHHQSFAFSLTVGSFLVLWEPA